MDMKKKLLFVFNPCSGKAQIKNQLLDIVDTMVKADYEVTIYPTQCAGDAGAARSPPKISCVPGQSAAARSRSYLLLYHPAAA